MGLRTKILTGLCVGCALRSLIINLVIVPRRFGVPDFAMVMGDEPEADAKATAKQPEAAATKAKAEGTTAAATKAKAEADAKADVKQVEEEAAAAATKVKAEADAKAAAARAKVEGRTAAGTKARAEVDAKAAVKQAEEEAAAAATKVKADAKAAAKQAEDAAAAAKGKSEADAKAAAVKTNAEGTAKLMPKRPILKFGVGNGLHSQLVSFIDGIVVATLFREYYDVVLPAFYGSAFFYENKSQILPIGELYDTKHFIECVSIFTNNSLRVYEEIPGNYTTETITYTPKHMGRVVNDENNWNSTQTAFTNYAKPGKVIDIGRWYVKFQYLLPETEHFSIRRNVVQCIQPAPPIKKDVTKAVQKMREMYPSNIASIHPRLEEDWKQHCQNRKLTDCYLPQEEWVSRLQEENAPSKIFVFGGAKLNRTLFEEKNFTVFTKDNLLEPHTLSSFQYASNLACIDFFIALEIDLNYGFLLSSMDILLYEFRLYQCKPLDSIHFRSYGSNWLQSAGGITKSFFSIAWMM